MPYQSILEKLVKRIPGAIGAILVDWEGEAVQEFCHCDPYEIRFTAAHQVILLSQLREMQNRSDRKETIEDLVVTSSNAHLVIGSIDDEYSLVLSIDRSSPLQPALHHFRVAVAELRKEI